MPDDPTTRDRVRDAKRKLELAAESEQDEGLKAKVVTGAAFLAELEEYAAAVESTPEVSGPAPGGAEFDADAAEADR